MNIEDIPFARKKQVRRKSGGNFVIHPDTIPSRIEDRIALCQDCPLQPACKKDFTGKKPEAQINPRTVVPILQEQIPNTPLEHLLVNSVVAALANCTLDYQGQRKVTQDTRLANINRGRKDLDLD